MFDKLIVRCNEFLWVYQYPGGQFQLAFASMQHRDLVRTFFAGVLETLLLTGQNGAGMAMSDEYKRMTETDWLPDERFRPPQTAHNPPGGE